VKLAAAVSCQALIETKDTNKFQELEKARLLIVVSTLQWSDD